MRRNHRALGVVLALAIPLSMAATAFACGSLATLRLNRATAVAGDPVQARGGNFNTSPRASAVQLRFNSRNGRVLWEGRPRSNGRFSATFDAPKARRGYYVILATQTGPDGRPAAGTPGRAPLRLKRRASSSSSLAPAAPWPAAHGGDQAGPPQAGGMPVLAWLGLALFGIASLAAAALRLRPPRRRRYDVAESIPSPR